MTANAPRSAHSTSPRRVAGRRAGQREDLVARLRDLAGNYPAGIGLLKEFLQNADDAGATWVRFTLDLREHASTRLPDDRMGPLLGPALLVESDQTFSEDDIANIQRIGAAGKIDDAGKTGRFGLGFNTVYSITDYPSFATRDQIMTFDPFFDAVALHGEEPGISWTLDTLWAEGPDWPRAFDLSEGVTWLDTTVFRIPLRTEAQAVPGRIGRTGVPSEQLRGILESLAEWGERLVIYLRSVLEVEARVVHPDGRCESLVLVRTVNAEVVQAARASVLPAQGATAGALLDELDAGVEAAPAVYDHAFEVRAPGTERQDSWLVCQGMFAGEEGEAIEAARAMAEVGEKAIPLAGAAIRIRRAGPTSLLPLPTEGALCCTLPITQGLPIGLALNARWSLASSRAYVRFGGEDSGDEAVKVAWNHALAEHVVPAAVAALFGHMRAALDDEGVRAAYAAWPDLDRLATSFDRALAEGIYSALSLSRSIRVEASGEGDWVRPVEATRAPVGWSGPLVDAVIADGLALVRPEVPAHVLRGLSDVGEEGEAPEELTPAEARAWLSEVGGWAGALGDAPRICLRTVDHVLELLRFCSEGGAAQLGGLPLALMDDGGLRTFGHGAAIYFGDAAARSLFRARPHWFLSAEAERIAGLKLAQAKGLIDMNPGNVIKNLNTHLPKDQDGTWSPHGDAVPNEAWLTELYEWLARLPDLKSHLPVLKGYAMVPDSEGRLVRPSTANTPLLPTGASPALLRAFRAFGVPLVPGSSALIAAITAVAKAATGLVRHATPADVLDTLADQPLADVLPASPDRRELLSWLGEAHAELNADSLEKLKALVIWPTTDGQLSAADAERVFLPRGYNPPPGFASVTLLDAGPEDRWIPLLNRLGVRPLELADWIVKVFLPAFGGLAPDARLGALRWLRDDGMRALTGPEEGITRLREALRTTPLLEGDDQALYPASRLYHPEARDAVVRVLGPTARFPDMERVFHEDGDTWLSFFSRLRLHRQPLDRDVVVRVEQVLASATAETGDQCESALIDVYDHLCHHWEKGEHDKSDLAVQLRKLAWIPAMQRPVSDDVALFKAPSVRFLRPAEVYPARLVHLAASQVAFVARGKEDAAVRSVLGMPSEVKPDVVLAHFCAVRDRWASPGHGDLRHGAVGRASSGLYRLVGQLVGSQASADKAYLAKIRSELAGTECIWDQDGRRFWRADCTFVQGGAALVGLRAQITAVGQEAGGLDVLGRRLTPVATDFVAVLRELANQAGDAPLSDSHLKAALRCWAELRDASAHLTPDLPVPTAAGTLLPARDALVDDARYWRDRLASSDLPWIHPKAPEQAVLMAGAERVSDVVKERRDRWKPEAAARVERYCADRSRHLTSEAFALGVARLLAHAHPDADPPDLETVHRAVALGLVPCGELWAGLVCPRFGVEETVGVESVACLLDDDESPPQVWVATDDPEAVALELGRALLRRLSEASINGVEEVDKAALEAILRCATDRVVATLDTRKIRTLAYEAEDDVEGAEGDGSMGEPVYEPNEGAGDDGPPDEDDDEGDSGAQLRRGDVTSRSHGEPSSSGSWRGAFGRGAGGPPAIDAPPRERQPLADRVGEGAAGDGASAGDAPRSPPTLPHQGQSRRTGRSKGQFYSYLESARSGHSSTGDAAPGRVATELAALQYVDELEAAKGSGVVAMARDNEGYDRELQVPGEAEARIVEVKGLGGAWDGRGVRLTPAELRAAHHLRDRYWLYVVEFAKDPDRRRLYRVRDPAAQVTAYCLDQGWIMLAEPEESELVPAPGLVVYEAEVQLGIILQVEQRGEALRLTLKTPEGEERRLNWNPSRHHLRPGAA